MQAFINGQKVLTFQDKNPISQGSIGVYIDGTGFTLIADNFFAYNSE